MNAERRPSEAESEGDAQQSQVGANDTDIVSAPSTTSQPTAFELVIGQRDQKRRVKAELQSHRNELNDQIRVLTAELETLDSVVSTFERRARFEAAAAEPRKIGGAR